jgi:DNA-binding response OmpR family regulator
MPGSPQVIRFGPFELDVEKAELRKHGLRLRIQEQPFWILKASLENPGVTVSREEMVKRA